MSARTAPLSIGPVRIGGAPAAPQRIGGQPASRGRSSGAGGRRTLARPAASGTPRTSAPPHSRHTAPLGGAPVPAAPAQLLSLTGILLVEVALFWGAAKRPGHRVRPMAHQRAPPSCGVGCDRALDRPSLLLNASAPSQARCQTRAPHLSPPACSSRSWPAPSESDIAGATRAGMAPGRPVCRARGPDRRRCIRWPGRYADATARGIVANRIRAEDRPPPHRHARRADAGTSGESIICRSRAS